MSCSFFFFKQKTAYEMRSSDWSSDVCSSDLKSDRRANRAASYAKRFAAKEACSKALGTGFRDGVFWRDLGVVNLASGKPTMMQIGRASGRERVWQYV